ncbi:MAG: hypothetical protein KGJ59_02430 [Bacteroidota bacterium]|nr:hypothetical protein [Bacteroidota bacterium]
MFSRGIVLCLLAGSPCSFAQAFPPKGVHWTVVFKGSYTTSARFLYNVNEPDQFLNSNYFSSIFGFGGSVRANFSEDFAVGISTEKMKFSEQSLVQYVIGGNEVLAPVSEGFVVYPLEVSGYFFLPFSTEYVRVYLGGGVGAYFGERTYSVGTENMAAENSPSGFGIHVLTGLEYRLFPNVMLQGELKFRDPQFDSVNKFQHASAIVNGAVIPLSTSPETTRVNVNGITYTLGVAYTL